MEEDDINGLIQRCQKLKHKFRGVFAAENFSSKLKSNSFFNSKRVKLSKSWHALAPHM